MNTSNMSIADMDNWFVANLGYSFIAEAGGLDALLDGQTVEDVREWVADTMACTAD